MEARAVKWHVVFEEDFYSDVAVADVSRGTFNVSERAIFFTFAHRFVWWNSGRCQIALRARFTEASGFSGLGLLRTITGFNNSTWRTTAYDRSASGMLDRQGNPLAIIPPRIEVILSATIPLGQFEIDYRYQISVAYVELD